MVAVQSAIQASDAALVSELGSLLVAHTRIREPRWRLEAIVRRVPALVRFGVPLDATRTAIRDLGARALCPAPLREMLVDQLGATFELGYVRALWTPDWRGSTQLAVDAAVRAGGLTSIERVIERIVDVARPRLRYGMPRIVHEKSLADVIALVDDGRADEAERVARGLRAHDQVFATAHLARLDLRAGRSPRCVRGSHRAGAELLLVREAIAMGDVDVARDTAKRIDHTFLRDSAYLDIANALFDRGYIVEALRMSYCVQHEGLVGLREVVRDEIRLVVRRSREVHFRQDWRTSRDLPGWLRPRGWTCTADRDRQLRAAAFVRLSLRLAPQETGFITRYLNRVPARAFLTFLVRVGVDIPAALEALRRSSNASDNSMPRQQTVVDVLLVEHIAMRAESLVRSDRELPEAMRLGLAGLAANVEAETEHRSIRAGSLERMWFDEGIALSSSASRRRRVLIGVAQACIRSTKFSTELLRARLRTLIHLGGSLAADAIAIPLATLPLVASTFFEQLEVLCVLDAVRAGHIVLDRFVELGAAGIDRVRALEEVVASSGLSHDHARAYELTFRAVRDVLGDRAYRWFADFSRRWLARTGARLEPRALAWLRTCDLHREPQALLDELDALHASLLGGERRLLAKRLSTDENALRALLLTPPRVDPGMPSWDLARWQKLFAKASEPRPTVDTSIVRRCAQLLGRADAVRALANGDLAALGVATSIALTCQHKRFRIVLLDRCRDLLTFLRFPDVPMHSCFRSDSSYYDTTELEVLAAWRDPLTICFRIERELGKAFTPCGFLFGSFGEVGGEPAVLFNSLHVKPNTGELRVQILRAIERELCEPLRIRHLAIANVHGGAGELPDDYVCAEREVTRLRALTVDGVPETFVDDDVSWSVNTRNLITYLHWRDFERNHS